MPQAESNVEYLNSNKRNAHPGLMVDGGTNSHPDWPRPYWELLGSGWFDLDEFEMPQAESNVEYLNSTQLNKKIYIQG